VTSTAPTAASTATVDHASRRLTVPVVIATLLGVAACLYDAATGSLLLSHPELLKGAVCTGNAPSCTTGVPGIADASSKIVLWIIAAAIAFSPIPLAIGGAGIMAGHRRGPTIIGAAVIGVILVVSAPSLAN
jgi:hypothetical protein